MKRRIKITYIIDTIDTNLAGTEGQVLKMIQGLDKSEFSVGLVCFNQTKWFEANSGSLDCESKLIYLNRFRGPGALLRFMELVSYLRSTRPDIVHTFFPVGNIFGVLAARLAGVKTVISSRRDYGEWMTPKYLLFTRFVDRFVTLILANSFSVKELIERKERVPASLIQVILNGIELDKYRALPRDSSLKEKLGLSEQDKVVGIVANFRPMKRHETFIRGAADVLRSRKDVHFILLGFGPLQTQLENLTRELGVERNVHFVGSQKVPPYLSIMDVGVNCSEGEGLSNAIMEYMCAGVPCVVSKAGGNPDLIEDGVNGFTFDIGDYRGMAARVISVLDDDALRRKFIAEARAKTEREFSLDVIISKYQALYAKLANG